jgi:hypothetical protein
MGRRRWLGATAYRREWHWRLRARMP